MRGLLETTESVAGVGEMRYQRGWGAGGGQAKEHWVEEEDVGRGLEKEGLAGAGAVLGLSRAVH